MKSLTGWRIIGCITVGVAAIMTILWGVVLPQFSRGAAYPHHRLITANTLKHLHTYAVMFQDETGNWPDTLSELKDYWNIEPSEIKDDWGRRIKLAPDHLRDQCWLYSGGANGKFERCKGDDIYVTTDGEIHYAQAEQAENDPPTQKTTDMKLLIPISLLMLLFLALVIPPPILLRHRLRNRFWLKLAMILSGVWLGQNVSFWLTWAIVYIASHGYYGPATDKAVIAIWPQYRIWMTLFGGLDRFFFFWVNLVACFAVGAIIGLIIQRIKASRREA